MDKERVLAAFEASVRADLEAVARTTADTRLEATGSESRAENQYDTRATEAAYLAAGQGERLLALKALLEWLTRPGRASEHRAVTPGALVELDRDGVRSWVLFGPQGGPRAQVEGRAVSLISADAPLGEALRGLEAGDAAETESPTGPATVEVVRVR